MLFVKFIRKVQFVQVRLFGDDPLVRKLSARGGARHRRIYSGHSRRRGEVGFAQPREIILHQPVKGSRLRLSRVECFRRKKEREEKRKKRGGKDENFCSTMVREQAETGGSMKHPRCTFIGSHEQIYSCDAIPGYSRA